MISKTYPLEIALFVLFIVGIYYALWKIVSRIKNYELQIANYNSESRFKIYLKESFVFVFAVAIVFISIRGGFQSKPLRESYAFRNDVLQLGHLSLNPIFTVARVLFKGNEELQEFFPKEQAVAAVQELLDNNEEFSDKDFPLMRKQKSKIENRKSKMKNVVIFIMESWGAKNIGAFGNPYKPTPNFDSLAKQGMFFTQFFAAGQRTIQGVQAITASLPTFFSEDIIGSTMEQNALRPLGSILREEGYQTLFIHSAFRGSMGLEAYSKLTGFERFIAQDDFDDAKTKSDGTWGVFDEYAFERANEEFRKMNEPFCGVIMSVSSHAPFELPSNEFAFYADTIPNYKYLNALRYSDYALGKYFSLARSEKYFDNTIFIIVADHVEGFGEKSMYERFHIPCLIYSPKHISPQRIDNVHSQTDILPTVLDLLNLNIVHSSFGKSPFTNYDLRITNYDSNSTKIVNQKSSFVNSSAFLPNGNTFGWITDSFFLIANTERNIGLYQFRTDTLLKKNVLSEKEDETEAMRRSLFSYVQVGRNVLRENKLYKPIAK